MLIWLVFASFVGSCVAGPVSRLLGRWAGWGLALLPIGIFASLIAMAPVMEKGWVLGDGLNWAPRLGIYLTFRLDGFSFLMALLVTGIGALVSIYAGAYMTEKSLADRSRFFTLIFLFMTAMLGALLADNLIVMLLFWEATSILSFLLIGFDGKSARARRSALMSLHVTAGGGLAFLASIILIGQVLGTYSMGEVVSRADEIAAHPAAYWIVGGILIGAFTKSAQFPFHFWLPNAMHAPTPASAYLHSATMVKLGIYLLARFEPVIGAVPGGRETLIFVGGITMLTAAFQALRAEGFKTALAYSTVASLGILVMLTGLTGPAASVATIGFLFSHALYKAALFFVAGSVLHATGLASLRSMGGLVKFLPLTALAAILASLSMAGVPPFFGFISKEFLFQAQVESTSDLIPLAIAVVVNAVMVGIAGVITLRPFFLGRGKVTEVRHGETVGLVLAPLVLSLAGLVLSLSPEWVTRIALRPAVVSIYGRAVDVDVSLWHGLTPVLALSFVVVGTGALIAFNWKRIHLKLRSYAVDHYGAENSYDRGLRLLHRFAGWMIGRVQNGDMRFYLQVVFAAAAALVGVLVLASGASLRLPEATPFRAAPALVALIGLAGALAATQARSLLAVLVAVGLVGFAAALTFMMNGAPDLALTQFTVEALIVVLLTALLLAVPLSAPPTRSRRERRADIVLSAGVGAVMLVVLLDLAAGANEGAASAFYAAQSYVAAQGRNVVNVILVDFRAFDTLGETVVIAMSAVLAWSLLGPRSNEPMEIGAARRAAPAAFILRASSRFFFVLLLIVSVYILMRGHDQPGGGFVGGLVAALAFAMVALAHGTERARRTLRIHPVALVGVGIAAALASGVPALLIGDPFLTHLWFTPTIGPISVKASTTMLFDLGVYLVVHGGVIGFMLGLQREAER